MLNGSVKDSKVTNLRKVNGMNYTGGFIGHLGKSGTVDLDNLGALGDLLSAGAGVMDVFGSHVDRCSVEGVNEGFTVHSNNTIDQKINQKSPEDLPDMQILEDCQKIKSPG